MNRTQMFLALSLSSVLFGQGGGTFSGPAGMSNALNTIGQRSGRDVDLNVYASATGVYDTGLTPFRLTPGGEIERPKGLYGVEAGLGAYGRHSFRRSVLGVDYSGNFRHYPGGSFGNGSNQNLSIGYSIQKSRRLMFDFSGTAGTQTFGTAFVGTAAPGVVDANSLLFDNRTTFAQGGMNVLYSVSSRTVAIMGGSAYKVSRQAAGLVGVNGYTLNGSLQHQLSRRTTVGLTYQHTHFDFPRAFGESDIDMITGTFSRRLGRTLALEIGAGIFRSQVQGVQQTALDPIISALLGVGSVATIFYRENTMPTGMASLTQSFRKWSWGVFYSRTTSPGNGVYLTSRQENFGARYSFTGIRKASFSLDAGANSLNALGQELQAFRQYTASATFAYKFGGGLNLTTAYMRRRQDLVGGPFQRDSSRVSLGLAWTSGSLPISFR